MHSGALARDPVVMRTHEYSLLANQFFADCWVCLVYMTMTRRAHASSIVNGVSNTETHVRTVDERSAPTTNERQSMLTFESLPNEILVELFDYFTAFELFVIFDRCNSRFHQLIRQIPLHVNFQHVRKTTFDQFCAVLRTNPAVQSQIHSLVLSNDQTCGQIDAFLSRFSLDQFVHLRSLTFVQIESQNVPKIATILPALTTLHTFLLLDVVDLEHEENQILAALPIAHLQRLSLPSLPLLQTNCILTHLTIFGCTLRQLAHQCFAHTPLLEYLHVQNVYRTGPPMEAHESLCPVPHLKQLIIDNYEYLFDAFEIFVQLTPNLTRLTISAFDNVCLIDADRWQQLITLSLHSLTRFQFTFGLYCRGSVRNDIVNESKHFQNDFWCQQHHWHTECVLSSNSAVIYTVPYTSSAYRLTYSSERFSTGPRRDSHAFDAVTHLTLSWEAREGEEVACFPNVTSLTFEPTSIGVNTNNTYILRMEHIDSLRATVNLDHLTHLDISSRVSVPAAWLLAISTRASRLSSMTVHPITLSTHLGNPTLSVLFETMIRRLNIHQLGHSSFYNSAIVERLCTECPLLKHLTCCIDRTEHLLILLRQAANLSTVRVHLLSNDTCAWAHGWFVSEARQCNTIYRVRNVEVYTDGPVELYSKELRIWLAERE